ncbi:MAG TPA: serine hydroxymethyltransferase, partial [Tistrella mobilis]|nr:serine hydroxymethyltransferase [Tistrella mobilis]
TTHKTLRGPRGGIILTNDPDIARRIDKAVFPGVQGGPLMHVIAAKAVAFHEALQPDYRAYIHDVVGNAAALARTLDAGGLRLVTGGTDCHLVLVDLRPFALTGKAAVEAMEEVGLTANKNAVPFDTATPMVTSGIRLGSPACTTRGFGPAEFETVGRLILQVLGALRDNGGLDAATAAAVRAEVDALCARFPLPAA